MEHVLSRAASIPVLISMIMAGVVMVLVLEYLTVPSKRRVYGIALCVYLAAYITVTFLVRVPTAEARIRLIPFWTVRAAFSWANGKLTLRSLRFFREIVLNMVLFFPLGMLLSGWCRHRIHVLILGIALSVATELIQYVLHLGLMETDDVLNNTLGLIMGMMAYQVLHETGSALRT